MTKYSIVFLDEGVQAIIPKALYQAIVKVQVAGGFEEWDDACLRVAELSDHGSKKFEKAVKEEAMRLYRSRHLVEMNKALYTRHRSGVEEGKAYAKIRYPCSGCGQDMTQNRHLSEGSCALGDWEGLNDEYVTISKSELALLGGALALAMGVSDVALVTTWMTAFSSMQRKPTGMNSPVGITIGLVLLMPEFLLISVLGPKIMWVEGGVAVGLLVATVFFLLSLGRLIKREKFLP